MKGRQIRRFGIKFNVRKEIWNDQRWRALKKYIMSFREGISV